MLLIRVIIHIDMDAFYPSVEQRENPSLKHRPVIVGADPKGGKGRGVVMSCSYEARAFGVHSAQPVSMAYKLCPGGVYVHPNFNLYEQASEDVMQVLKVFTYKFEPMSIDEAFMDVTEKVGNFSEAEALATKIKHAIRERTQLTCSVGVAHNKSIAKIASDFKKPDGLTIVPPEKAREFLAPLPVGKIQGVGKKTSEILGRMGLKTIEELAATHPSKLTEKFGKYGTRLWNVANCIDDERVATSYSIKSISSETTFDEDVADRGEAMGALASLIADVYARVSAQKVQFRTISIKVRLEDFATYTRAKTHERHTNDRAVIEEYVKKLFSEFGGQKKIRLVGVRVANLRKMDAGQETIPSYVPREQRN